MRESGGRAERPNAYGPAPDRLGRACGLVATFGRAGRHCASG
jgi:hypothetical protein